MEAKGVVKQISKPQGFKKKDGTDGYKAGILIETEAKYNPLIYFDVFKDELRETLRDIEIGSEVKVQFNLSSRAGTGQYEGRFFHNVVAWAINEASIETAAAIDEDSPF
jgi:hypothetical protein